MRGCILRWDQPVRAHLRAATRSSTSGCGSRRWRRRSSRRCGGGAGRLALIARSGVCHRP